MSTEDDEPGVPGNFDDDGRPYFFPGNQQRPADAREQRDGFVPRWEYPGHGSDRIKSIQATGRDPFERIRFVSTGGTSVHSWLEGGDGDSVKIACTEHVINALTFVPPLNVVAAASEDKLLVFDGRTMRCLATLPTSKKVLLQLQYNQARDEIISGGSDGCFVWRLAAISCELSSLDAVLFELTLLHGFKGSSSWAGNMVWDEASQIILTIDGMRVKTYDATTTVTTTKEHTINKAHESPVTVGLWIHESENIVTGCMGGDLKIWACQHTDVTGAKRLRRQKKKRSLSRRQGKKQQPALVESFEGHCGTITGLVRHSLNSSYVVSSGADGTLRVWDVDRLCPVTNVLLPYTIASLWATCLGGESRLSCAGTDGGVRTMVLRQVSHPLSFDADEVQRVRYFSPVRRGADEARSATADDEHDGRDEKGRQIRDREQHGLLLVQKKHGLWGLMSESLLLPTSIQQTTHSTEGVVSLEASEKNIVDPTEMFAEHESGEEEISALEEDTTTSSLFFAWPPLSCVVERYSHHVVSRRRRKVICLADAGVMDVYHFGPTHGETRKHSSQKIDLHSNGATATCMCLLPDPPTCIEAILDRVLASSSHTDATFDGSASGDDDFGRGEGDAYRCAYHVGMGGKKGANRIARGNKDQVIAIGTSHGGLVLVETVFGGTTLDYLEGVFASGVSHMAFCDASTDDAIRSDEATHGTEPSAPFATGSERLICAGFDVNGSVTIKGLSVSSLMEKFSLRLVENPTHVRVASRRPIVAIGYADGALNAIHFGQDRVRDLDGIALVGAHKTKINTIAFSTRRRCMASGSADGYIVIWDLNGQKLHTIFLQTPALAVEFMEVSGELLVSSSSGLSRIPPCQWCPLKLLVANERADRTAATKNSNSNGSSNGARQTPDTPTGFSPLIVQHDVTSEREGVPGVQINLHPPPSVPSRRRRHVEHKERKVGGGSDSPGSCRLAGREQAKKGNATAGTGLHGGERVIRDGTRANGFDEEQDQRSGAIAEGRRTPPEAGYSSAPVRWQKLSLPRGGNGSWEGTSLSPKRADNKINILDRMSAKVSSMPTSPPPSLRATKRSTFMLHTTPPGSRASTYDHLGGEETPRQAAAGEQCAPQDEQLDLGSPIETTTTLPLTETDPCEPGTTPVADGTPVIAERTTTDDKPVEACATNEPPDQREERLHPESGGRSVEGVDLAASSSIKSSRTDCSPISGSVLDGVVPCILDPHVAMPWWSTRGQPCTTPLENSSYGGALYTEEVVAEKATRDAKKPFVRGRGRPIVLKTAAWQRLARDAPSKPHSQKASPESGPGLASTTFAISGQAVATALSAGPRLAKKLHCSTESDGNRNLSPFTMPSTPACTPPLWDEAHDAPLAISPYPRGGRRTNRLVPASTPPMLGGGGIGAGTAAAIATKDVHNVVPPTSTSRAITKPIVVGDLESSVPRPPPSPSPPASGVGTCRAFGVISPRLWSEGGGDCCQASPTPRFNDSEASPWTPNSHTREGTSWGCIDRRGQRTSFPIPGSTNTSFFPVRPRPGRSIPVPFRNWEQVVPQN